MFVLQVQDMPVYRQLHSATKQKNKYVDTMAQLDALALEGEEFPDPVPLIREDRDR